MHCSLFIWLLAQKVSCLPVCNLCSNGQWWWVEMHLITLQTPQHQLGHETGTCLNFKSQTIIWLSKFRFEPVRLNSWNYQFEAFERFFAWVIKLKRQFFCGRKLVNMATFSVVATHHLQWQLRPVSHRVCLVLSLAGSELKVVYQTMLNSNIDKSGMERGTHICCTTHGWQRMGPKVRGGAALLSAFFSSTHPAWIWQQFNN